MMLDCGIHPGRTGDDALPFFDSGPDAAEIDLILISHFHLDHAASLPYFTEKVQARLRARACVCLSLSFSLFHVLAWLASP